MSSQVITRGVSREIDRTLYPNAHDWSVAFWRLTPTGFLMTDPVGVRPTDPREPELTGLQRALVEALGDRTELVTYYLGCRRVLRDELNPDRVAQSAHSIRELLEKSPKYFDVPAVRGARDLKAEANNLSAVWAVAVKKSACQKDGAWEGEIDSTLRKYLLRAANFFEWLREQRPPRVEEARGFLRNTDPSPYPLPDRIEQLRLQEWDIYRVFFVGAAHHHSVELQEYEQWLGRFGPRFMAETLKDWPPSLTITVFISRYPENSIARTRPRRSHNSGNRVPAS